MVQGANMEYTSAECSYSLKTAQRYCLTTPRTASGNCPFCCVRTSRMPSPWENLHKWYMTAQELVLVHLE
jgi:hypothetical protein